MGLWLALQSPTRPVWGAEPEPLASHRQVWKGQLALGPELAKSRAFCTGKKAQKPSAEEWMYQLWSIHTAEYHSAPKRAEAPTHTPVWTNRGSIP